MRPRGQSDKRTIDEQAALRAVVEGTAAETGEAFYGALVENLAATLDTCGAWVTEYDAARRRLRALAFWFAGERLDGLEYDIRGTACETAINETRLVHIPDRVLSIYGGSPDHDPGQAALGQRMSERGVLSYLGVPLLGEDRRVLGHLAVLDDRPMPRDERLVALFEVFATRAVAEMRRLRLEAAVREREAKLDRLIAGAMDGIVEFDVDGRVTLINPAAERVFGGTADALLGRPICELLTAEGRDKLDGLLRRLAEAPAGERSVWIAGGLTARRADGAEFPAEATLSRYAARRGPCHALILRSVHDRLEAERTIDRLAAQTAYLREEIRAEHDVGAIVGESPAIAAVLRDVARVAATDAAVLISGETGTGKELFARAIHEASRRRDKPLISVNCAAVPAHLIESEFFGHERGAFTGATQRRQGRFELADGGTIFLDEIGDLPLDLQGKLLRVLQEGEFEPVGSSRTRRVDARVLSATNRDLERAVAAGQFREDLYYRLNVFPLRLPPLRARGDDVVRLAAAFVTSLAPRLGVPAAALSNDDVVALRGYHWPGNVRELRNVIERALITAGGGRLDIGAALRPSTAPAEAPAAPPGAAAPHAGDVLTVDGLRGLERSNILRALEAAGGRISGPDGAAARLGTKPSTLRSRMAALGIDRGAGRG
jgi:PAS domain S-box-containing protein